VRVGSGWLLSVVLLAVATACSSGNELAATPASPVLTEPYILVFHACDTSEHNCFDWRHHRVYLAQSADGATWSPVPGYEPREGSVPDAIRRGNTLYLYVPGELHRYRIDLDRWESPVEVELRDAPDSNETFVDPSLTLDEEGRLVMFYLVAERGGPAPASCREDQSSCVKVFHSATEVDGSDGSKFVVDAGSRVEVPISGSEIAADPDILTGPDGYVLYVSRGPRTQAFVAAELRGEYQPVALPDGTLTMGGGVPSGYYDSETKLYWTYVHSSDGTSAPSSIRRAVHPDFGQPLAREEFSTVLSGDSVDGLGPTFSVESPGFAVNTP
jgi:hypothetical protein